MGKRTFDRALYFYRDQRKLNQSEMADLIKVSFRYYQKLESGKSEPSLTVLNKTLDNLGTTFAEFFAKPDPIQSDRETDWKEAARILDALAAASQHRRLAALYLLTKDDRYLDRLRALPGGAPYALMLKKIAG